MKKVYMCARMPHGDEYVGGVASIVNHYIGNKDIFSINDVDVRLFDYIISEKCGILGSKVKNIIYGLLQRRAIIKQHKKEHMDVIHIHTSRELLFFKDVLLANTMKKRGIKTVLTIHVGDIETVFRKLDPIKGYIIKLMNRYVDKVLFMSENMRQQFIDSGLDREIGQTLYNFWDFPVKEHKKERNENLNVLYIGSINREKGIAELLEAMGRCEGVKLDICGTVIEPDFKEPFEKKCDELSDRVIHHGYANDEEKSVFLSNADVLILPSYREGFPLVTLEACAAGCAMILTQVGAIKEIYDENNAVFVERKSSLSIEKALIELKNNRDKIEKMQAFNKEYSKKFSIQHHIDTLCKIYDGLF